MLHRCACFFIRFCVLMIFIAGGMGCSSAPKKMEPIAALPPQNTAKTADSEEAIDSQIREFEDEIPETNPLASPSSSPIEIGKPTSELAEKTVSESGSNTSDDSADDSESDSEDDIPEPPRKNHTIPATFNNKVADWVRYFSQKDRERFQRYLDRGEAYREVVENILEENHVPTDLYYLGLIESGFDHTAKSTAKAVGVWQFIKSAGKLYGLTVDRYVDERKDPIHATEAAAKYLRDLYRQFGSWYLALAAYNAGPGRIAQAIRKGNTHDFWELVERRKLPRETMEYVPKFLAARYIGDHPDLFAFYINEEKKYPDVELVKVPSPIRFSAIERTCAMPEGTLQFVNPQYLADYTHPARTTDEIWVPQAYKTKVEKQFEGLKKLTLHVRPVRDVKLKAPARLVYHRVRAGESLKSIARKQGLSVAYLKRVNGLKSSRIRPGQRLKLTATEYRQRKVHPRSKRRKVWGR